MERQENGVINPVVNSHMGGDIQLEEPLQLTKDKGIYSNGEISIILDFYSTDWFHESQVLKYKIVQILLQ